MAAPTQVIESWLPGVQENGLNTLKNINFNSGSNTCDLPASTTINGVAVAGIGNISSSATTGNMFTVTNTGAYTGTGVMTITAASATTGTILALSAAGLTTGHVLTLTSAGVITTTGDILAVVGNSSTTSTGLVRVTANGLTTGTAVAVSSSSADTGTRSLVKVSNTASAATGATLFELANTSTKAPLKTTTGLTSTHFQAVGVFGGVTLWVSDATDPNGALTGTAGDICFNGASSKPAYCTGTTSWTNLV